jgi:hypothetical protein
MSMARAPPRHYFLATRSSHADHLLVAAVCDLPTLFVIHIGFAARRPRWQAAAWSLLASQPWRRPAMLRKSLECHIEAFDSDEPKRHAQRSLVLAMSLMTYVMRFGMSCQAATPVDPPVAADSDSEAGACCGRYVLSLPRLRLAPCAPVRSTFHAPTQHPLQNRALLFTRPYRQRRRRELTVCS